MNKKELKKLIKEGKVLVIPIGYPGSGKSTFFRKMQIHNIASPDEERLALNPQGVDVTLADGQVVKGIDQSVSPQAWKNAEKKLFAFIDEGKSVAFDATNLQKGYYEKYIEYAKKNGYTVVALNFLATVGVEEALRRNEKRWGTIRYVPPEVIRRMAERRAKVSKKFDAIVLP